MAVDGWEETNLGAVASVNWGNTSLTKASYIEDGYTAFSATGADGFLDAFEHDGDGVVLSAIGARCGRCFYASGKWTAIKNTIVVKDQPEKSDIRFLFQYLNRDNVWPIAGGAQPFIGLGNARNMKVCLPPLEEQKKIAEILGIVDEAIAKTEAVISQTQKVKQGLLQSLLTKGIGHTKFKHTEIGEIPESWEISTIEELSDRVTSGSRGWAEYYSDEGAAFIRITNLKRNCIYPDMSDLKRVKLPAGSAEGVRTKLRTGDLLISITADLGIIGYIKDDSLGEAYINQHISLVSLNPKRVHAGFAAYFLSAPFMQRYIQKLNDGGAKAGLNLPTIRKLPLPVPDIKEQNLIYQTLSEIDHYLLEGEEQLRALQNLKKGLMSDLLTGRVRVKLDKKSDKAA
jgi:type I restriction enzyme S subunit